MLGTDKNTPFYAQGLRFSCKRCSGCCRYEAGFVFLSENDLSQMAAAMKMAGDEFIEAYCRWIPSVNGTVQLSLREKSNFDCIFWTLDKSSKAEAGPRPEGACSVYSARPLQCRAFPFWHSILSSSGAWKANARDCPGIGRGDLHTRDSIEKWLSTRELEPIISRRAD